MSEMLSIASGFQYAINIGYDLYNDEKLQNFIPTQAALNLLEDILYSTSSTSTERSRVLIGAYGKGKSHIVLMILSMLMKRDRALFANVMEKAASNPSLMQAIDNYYAGNNKILPVVITGSNTSISQAFLVALQRTLSDNDMLGVMPETNYKAAVSVINRWKEEFPKTYTQFARLIGMPVSRFTTDLENYSTAAYETFERVYPSLTAGSTFNPFLGFDVVELYENVARGIKEKGYTGIYIVYDEFSKYLEANITNASLSDTKMLQDFAEKSNRSGDLQMHIMLISHKEISNYIDQLPKQKVDGWRGVSERFKHIHLNNNFSQTYDIISSVIQKRPNLWERFCQEHREEFFDLERRYQSHTMFIDNQGSIQRALYGCYPLHPVSTFILPRLSERVAQNERTLFTFLSSDGSSTLPAALAKYNDNSFLSITPDVIYDYFEPLFKKEAYSSDIYTHFILTSNILSKINGNVLECKIVKTIALIYILEQFEKIKPTKEEIIGIYSLAYPVDKIEEAISSLIEKEYVIYLKRSNNYLRLKQSSGVDIHKKISDMISVQSGKFTIKDTLNASNFDNYIYPARYNDEREMTRYFSFKFIDETEIGADTNWEIKSSSVDADGVIYGVLVRSEASIATTIEAIKSSSSSCNRCIFIVPKHYQEIEEIVYEFNAAMTLRDHAVGDSVLFDEYEVIVEDLNDVIKMFMSAYTHPEEYRSFYIYNGLVQNIHRKAALTALLSRICDEVYSHTPVINNEAINKNDITTISANSRNKIIAALLRNDLETNLGLAGSGQEVSIMRSTLVRTGIWNENNGLPEINLTPEDERMRYMLATISTFINSAKERGNVSFAELYVQLTNPEYHIGLRRGLVPLYLAVVLHEYKKHVIIRDIYSQVPISLEVLLQINADPSSFTLSFLDWNPEKERYIQELAHLFRESIVEAERDHNSYDYVSNAMKRWFLSLPKYAKEAKTRPDGSPIDKRYQSMMKLLRQNLSGYELLFVKMPAAFGYTAEFNYGVVENIGAAKKCYDSLIEDLKSWLIKETRDLFTLPSNSRAALHMSLASIITDWCESLDSKVFEQLFPDGTDRCLRLFRSVTNDEDAFILRLAKLATDLRIEDWDGNTAQKYFKSLSQYKETAEKFVSRSETAETERTSTYQLTFVDDCGVATTKRFDRVEFSSRGKLLYNQITASLNAMGHSISEQEKRQIVMEILKKLC